MRFDQVLENLRQAVKESGPEKFAHITTVRKVAVPELAALLDDYDRIDGLYRTMMEELLTYMEELDVLTKEPLTMLIRSHRYLRNENMRSIADKRADREKAWEEAQTMALDANWVKLEDLRKMTLSEVSRMLREDE